MGRDALQEQVIIEGYGREPETTHPASLLLGQISFPQQVSRPDGSESYHILSVASTFPLPPCRQKDVFSTGYIDTETFFPCPQFSINPNPPASHSTSLQYCAEHKPAAPTEIQHSLDSSKANSSPQALYSPRWQGRVWLGAPGSPQNHMLTLLPAPSA